MKKMNNGSSDLLKGNPATQSMKDAFKELIPELPDGWKKKMYQAIPALNTPSGATRLTKIRQGIVAPTLDELKAAQKIAQKK